MLPLFLRRRRPRLLVTHAWLRGNLGDLCICEQLVRGLRERVPGARIDLVSVPAGDWRGGSHLRGLCDSYGEHGFDTDLSDVFREFDAVIVAPGGGLQSPDDARGAAMLRDAAACAAMGIRHAFAGHSLHPSFDTSQAAKSFFVAREPESHALLLRRGHRVARSADPAWLRPMPARASQRSGTLLFLRHNHVHNARLERNELTLDGKMMRLHAEPLTLASSDPRRDGHTLRRLASEWGIAYEPSETLEHLLALINRSAHVIGDRYHPVIFARMLGVPATYVRQDHSLRDLGLQTMLDGHTVAELQRMAVHGLDELCAFVTGRSLYR